MTDGNKIRTIRERQQKNNRTTKLFFVCALAILFIFLLIFMYANLFNIKSIKVESSDDPVYSNARIVESCNVKKGDNLIKVKKSDVSSALTQANPYIKEAVIQKKFPSTLVIKLEHYHPAMALTLGDDIFLMASDGTVLESVNADGDKPEGVCYINVPFVSECIQGERIRLENEEAYEILTQIYTAFEKNGVAEGLTSLDVVDKFNIKASVENRFDIIFGSYEEAETKAGLLAKVLSGDIWTDASGIIDVSDSREAAVRLTGSAAN